MTPKSEPTAKDLLAAAAGALAERKEEVNQLNVFPVPDGDTGTNMVLTMEAVLAEIGKIPGDPSLPAMCHAIRHGSLMGARGNSGVILSQILRGLCEVLQTAEKVDADLVARALERAVTVSFQAVRKPVEGTMLTVVKDTAAAAREAADEDADLDALLERAADEAWASVRSTPQLLDVLAEAGVVDAGGFGLALLVEGLVAAAEGHGVRSFDVRTPTVPLSEMDAEPEDDWNDAEYLYCTEFLIIGEDLDRDEMAAFVASRGGSELVVGEGDTLKVHVHVDDPAEILAHAMTFGQLADVHVNNMRVQSAERSRGLAQEPRSPYGIVAVAAGEGLARILESLGVGVVVSGGQTMNPSTADLLDATETLNAERIIILPNNKNVVMTARQVADVATVPIHVVPTSSVPQAFAALLAFDEHADPEVNVEEMTAAAEDVRVGEVTTAVKDSKGAAVGDITEGQIIGIVDHEIVVTGGDVIDVAVDTLSAMADGGETLTLLAGSDLSDEDLERLATRIGASHPQLEVESHRGDQPLYPVIMSVE